MSILKHPDNYKRIAGANARRIAELSESKKVSPAKPESKQSKKLDAPATAPDAPEVGKVENPYTRLLRKIDEDRRK